MFKLKNKTKKRMLKVYNGTISILLCILITPFISIAASLVEYSRYQQAKQSLDEMIDSSALSVLANFDKYIEERFGLMALSQETPIKEIKDDYKPRLDGNLAMLGKSITLGETNVIFSPDSSLANNVILGQQVIDYSETTVLTDMALKDLNLDELFSNFDSQFAEIEKVTNKMKELTKAVESMVTAGTKFKDKINSISTNIKKISQDPNQLNVLISSINTLYSEVASSESEVDLNAENSAEDNAKDKAISKMSDKYKEKVEAVMTNSENLYETISLLMNDIGGLRGVYGEFTGALSTAKQTLGESSAPATIEDPETGEDINIKDNNKSNEANAAYSEVINAVELALKDAGNEAVNVLEGAFNDSLGTLRQKLAVEFNIFELLNAPDDTSKYEIWEGTIWSILKTIHNSESKTFNFAINFTIVKNVLDFDASIENIFNDIGGTFVEKAQSGLSDILTGLVNAIMAIFKLDIFYNGNFDAYLSDEIVESLGGGNDDYQKFLEALIGMQTAVSEFISSIVGIDLFGALKAVWNLFENIGKLVTSVATIIGKLIENIAKLVGEIGSLNFEELYKRLLTAGYMTHNLPNRTNGGDMSVTVNFGNGISYNTNLIGKATTGFEYKNIIVPDKKAAFPYPGLDGIATAQGTGGNDETFRGAELEYIVAGTRSEIFNQVTTFLNIYFLRLILNLGVVFTDKNVATMASAASMASWVVYILVLLSEPLVDTVLLANGTDVPIWKSGCYLTPAGIPKLLTKLSDIAIKNEKVKTSVDSEINTLAEKLPKSGYTDLNDNKSVGSMDYSTTVLLVLLITTSKEDMLTRLSNIIYLESKAYYGEKPFDRSLTYTVIDSEVTATFNPFINIFGQSGSDLFTVTRKRQRGY